MDIEYQIATTIFRTNANGSDINKYQQESNSNERQSFVIYI